MSPLDDEATTSWSVTKGATNVWHKLVITSSYKTTALFGLVSTSTYILFISAFLLALSVYTLLHLEMPVALYTALWAVQGSFAAFVWTFMPSRRAYLHELLTQLSFWAYIMTLVQYLSVILHTFQGVYFIYLVPDLARQCAFVHLYLCFCIGLPLPSVFVTWSTRNWGVFAFALAAVVCLSILTYTAEVYRGFYRSVLDAGCASASFTETLISGSSSTEGECDTRDPEKSPSRLEVQRQDYNNSLTAYYAQFGELGDMAKATGLPVEEFIQNKIPEQEQAKWWAILKTYQV